MTKEKVKLTNKGILPVLQFANQVVYTCKTPMEMQAFVSARNFLVKQAAMQKIFLDKIIKM